MRFMCIVILSWIISNTLFGSAEACRFGAFGRDCMFSCHCTDDADCDDTSGHCNTGCAHGWDGGTCQRRNAAFGRPTSQKNGTSSQNASYAVDDAMSTCSSSKSNVPGWWSVTLGGVKRVRNVVIKAASVSDIQGWRIYVGMDEKRVSMTLCGTIRVSGTGSTVSCGGPIDGKHVMVVNRQGPVEICDFRVKVCSPHWFGTDCSHVCNCADQEEVCDSISGACATGCDAGWTGQDCQIACKGNRYGKDCRYECGYCADGTSCDHVTGTCNNGCKPGWTGMFCTQQCPVDMHGPHCKTICGNCYGIDACDSTGNCIHGCEPGYTGNTCVQECADGWFGTNCIQGCGKCASGSRCDPKIGVCPHGCQPGWQGVFCTQECPHSFYGKACREQCVSCLDYECDTFSGNCTLGCASGLTGSSCDKVCLEGTFGMNCSQQCGHCSQGEGRICNVTSGTCEHGCLPGYRTRQCSKMCYAGYYGSGCLKCGVCAPGTTCDTLSGACPEGCALGYFGGLCSQSEPFSDEGGPQLAIFLGVMVTMVIVIMVLVTVCFVLIWQREHLPEMTTYAKKDVKKARLLDQNGFIFDETETTVDI